jgi:hypothetical protein
MVQVLLCDVVADGSKIANEKSLLAPAHTSRRCLDADIYDTLIFCGDICL